MTVSFVSLVSHVSPETGDTSETNETKETAIRLISSPFRGWGLYLLLPADLGEEVGDGGFRCGVGGETFDKLRTDDRSAAVAACLVIRHFVGDAEPDQTLMFQVHVVDTTEVT